MSQYLTQLAARISGAAKPQNAIPSVQPWKNVSYFPGEDLLEIAPESGRQALGAPVDTESNIFPSMKTAQTIRHYSPDNQEPSLTESPVNNGKSAKPTTPLPGQTEKTAAILPPQPSLGNQFSAAELSSKEPKTGKLFEPLSPVRNENDDIYNTVKFRDQGPGDTRVTPRETRPSTRKTQHDDSTYHLKMPADAEAPSISQSVTPRLFPALQNANVKIPAERGESQPLPLLPLEKQVVSESRRILPDIERVKSAIPGNTPETLKLIPQPPALRSTPPESQENSQIVIGRLSVEVVTEPEIVQPAPRRTPSPRVSREKETGPGTTTKIRFGLRQI